MTRRAFTIDEANAMLPYVRSTLDRIGLLRHDLRERSDKLAVLDALWGPAVEDEKNPDHNEFRGHRRAVAGCAEEIERLIRDGLVGRNIRFPAGGLEHGLIDFPTTLDGRWILLCWRYGEREVAFWHELNGGYRGRRPITLSQKARMGRPDDPALSDDSPLDF